MQLRRALLTTPVGPMLALASDDALCALEFHMDGRMSRLEARLSRFYSGPAILDGRNDVIAATRAWLDAYFEGASADANALPLDARGNPFEQSVWAALRTIPPGSTASYGQIAKQIGSPSASRAVGLANGANPIAIVVPCHRVIGASGKLVGYGGGLPRKQWLLDHEQRYWSDEAAGVTGRRDQRGRTNASGRLPFD